MGNGQKSKRGYFLPRLFKMRQYSVNFYPGQEERRILFSSPLQRVPEKKLAPA